MKSLLAFALLVVVAEQGLAADPPESKRKAPAIKADTSGVLLLPLGGMNSLKLRSDKVPEDIIPSDDSVVGVRLDPQDAHSLLLIGRASGSAILTVVYSDKKRETYDIVVEMPRKAVAKLVRPGFVAFALNLPPENAVGGYLSLSDYVIVYSTKRADAEKKATVLMKNIRVLGEPMLAPRQTEIRLYVLLEVTTDEAKLLKSALESGSLSLGLVAEADTKDEKALRDRKGDVATPMKSARERSNP